MYDRFGYRGPFIFGISATGLDLIGRLIIIERKYAIRWRIDPAAVKADATVTLPAANSFHGSPGGVLMEKSNISGPGEEDIPNTSALTSEVASSSPDPEGALPPLRNKHLTLVDILVLFGKSPRTLIACFLIFVRS